MNPFNLKPTQLATDTREIHSHELERQKKLIQNIEDDKKLLSELKSENRNLEMIIARELAVLMKEKR